MLIRFPVLLVWNLTRNVLRLPFVLLGWMFSFLGDKEPKYVRFRIQEGVVRWSHPRWIDYFRDDPDDLTVGAWRRVLEKLAKHKRCAGIVCEVDRLNASLPIIEDMRGYFSEFRKSGKKIVVVYKNHFGMGSLLLGSAADATLVQPSANVMIVAPGIEGIYFSELLKQFGVEMVMERVGAHKNAPERMTRAFPSPTGRRDMEELLQHMLGQILPPLAEAQGVDVDAFYQRLASGIFSPEEALEAGLIDGIRYADRIEAYLQDKQPVPFEYPELPVSPAHHTYKTVDAPKPDAAPETDAKADAEVDAETEVESARPASEEQSAADAVDGDAGEEASGQAIPAEAAPEEAKASAEVATSLVYQSTATPLDADKASADGKKGDDDEDDDEDEIVVDIDDFSVDGRSWWRWTPIRKKPQLAVIPVVGTITDESSASLMAEDEAVRDPILEAIKSAKENPRVKGVLAYINSRGGSGTASEAIWHAFHELDKTKPVIAYLDDYAASGGYYIACGARHMIANPWCVTGSIGVFGGKPVAEDLLKRLRLGVARIGDTPGSRMLSVLSRPSPYERQRFREQMMLFYERFVLRVADNRKRHYDDIEPLAQGRVYVAQQALDCGLIDEIGGFHDAIKKLCALTGLPEKTDVRPYKTSSKLSWVEQWLQARAMGQQLHRSGPLPGVGRSQLDQLVEAFSAQGLLTGAVGQGLALGSALGTPGLSAAALTESLIILSLLSRGQVTAWFDGRLQL